MKTLILGGYSCLPFGLDEQKYADICDKQMTPLLSYLYLNAQFSFTLYISPAEIDWIEKHKPELNLLIKRLIKRKSVSVLVSAYYQSFVPFVNAVELCEQTEKMRTASRFIYKNKSKGFFAAGGMWSNEYLPRFLKYDINYAVVPFTDHKEVVSNGPFSVCGFGNKFTIYPSCSELSEKANDYADGKIDLNKLSNDTAKFASRTNGCVPLFLDMDMISGAGRDVVSLISEFYEIFKEHGYQFATTDNNLDFDYFFLPSGSYCDACDFIGRTYRDRVKFLGIARVNMARMILNDKKLVKRQDKATLSENFMPLSSGSFFLDRWSGNESWEREVYSKFLYSLFSFVPKNFEFCMPDFKLNVYKTANYFSLVDLQRGFICEIGDAKRQINLLDCGELFRCIVLDDKGCVRDVQARCSSRDDFFVEFSSSVPCSVSKSVQFADSKIACKVHLVNSSDSKITLSYGLTVKLSSLIKTEDGDSSGFSFSFPGKTKKMSLRSDVPFAFVADTGLVWKLALDKGEEFNVTVVLNF